MIICVLNKADAGKFSSVYSGSTERFDDPDFIGLGMVDNDAVPPVPCAMVTASVIDRSVNIEWLYVLPEYRRKKAATALLDQLLKAADQCEADEVFCTFTEKNEGAAEFMDDFGFAVFNDPSRHDYFMKLRDFKTLPSEQPEGCSLDSFFNTDEAKLAAFNEYLENGDAAVGVPLPIDPADYSPLSVCVEKNGEISGLLLIRTSGSGENAVIEIPWVFLKKECIKAMPAVYALAVDALRMLYPEDTAVRFETLNRGMDSIIEKIAPDAEFCELYSAHWQLG